MAQVDRVAVGSEYERSRAAKIQDQLLPVEK